jgi:hypothetical protein
MSTLPTVKFRKMGKDITPIKDSCDTPIYNINDVVKVKKVDGTKDINGKIIGFYTISTDPSNPKNKFCVYSVELETEDNLYGSKANKVYSDRSLEPIGGTPTPSKPLSSSLKDIGVTPNTSSSKSSSDYYTADFPGKLSDILTKKFPSRNDIKNDDYIKLFKEYNNDSIDLLTDYIENINDTAQVIFKTFSGDTYGIKEFNDLVKELKKIVSDRKSAPTTSTPAPTTSTPAPTTSTKPIDSIINRIDSEYELIDLDGNEISANTYLISPSSFAGIVIKLLKNITGKIDNTVDKSDFEVLFPQNLNVGPSIKLKSSYKKIVRKDGGTDFTTFEQIVKDESQKIPVKPTSGATSTTTPQQPVIKIPPGISIDPTTSYVNSVMQTLYNIEEIRDAILSFVAIAPDANEQILLYIKQIFEAIRNKEDANPKPITDVDIIISVNKMVTNFIDNEYSDITVRPLQSRKGQDPYRFLNYIWSKITSEDIVNKYYSFRNLSKDFTIYLDEKIECLTTKKDSPFEISNPNKYLRNPTIVLEKDDLSVRNIQDGINNFLGNHFTVNNTDCEEREPLNTFNAREYNILNFIDESRYLFIKLNRGDESNFDYHKVEPNKEITVKTDEYTYTFKLQSCMCYKSNTGSFDGDHYYFYTYNDRNDNGISIPYLEYDNANVSLYQNKPRNDTTLGIFFVYKFVKRDEKFKFKSPEKKYEKLEALVPIFNDDGKLKTDNNRDNEYGYEYVKQECVPGDNKRPCPEPFNKFPDPPVRINERESLYYNLMNNKVDVNYLRKVKKQDFYYVLKKFKDITETVEQSAYLQMIYAYKQKPLGQWVIPDIIAVECWKLYIDDFLHDAVTAKFEDDRMLKLIFFLMRYVSDVNLYVDEPGNPTGKIHIIPYLYMYFRNPSIFGVKQNGRDIKTLMPIEKFMKIIFTLKLLNVDFDVPIYKNQAFQGYDRNLINSAEEISLLSKKNKPMKTVFDYCVTTERTFRTITMFEGAYKPEENLKRDERLLTTLILNDYTKFRYGDLKGIYGKNPNENITPKELLYFAYLLDDTSLAFSNEIQKGLVDTRSLVQYTPQDEAIKNYDSYYVNLEQLIYYKCDNIMNMYIPLLNPTLPVTPLGIEPRGFEYECRELVTAINNGSYYSFKMLVEEKEFPITYFTVNRIIYFLKKYSYAHWPGYEVYFNMLGLIIDYGVRFDKFQENVIKNIGKIESQQKPVIKDEKQFEDKTKEKLKENTYYAYFMKRYGETKLYQKICGMVNSMTIPLNIKEYLFSLGIDITQSNQKICKDLVAIREKYSDNKTGNMINDDNIKKNAREFNMKYLKNIIPNFDETKSNKDEYTVENLKKYASISGFEVSDPIAYNPKTLVWFQVEEESSANTQENKDENTQETQNQNQKKGKKTVTYIYPFYRFETLISSGKYKNIRKEEMDIPIDVINKMKNKLDYFETNSIQLSNIIGVSGAVKTFFVKADVIDNDESEYIFNSILRLCQSYGWTYRQLLSLTSIDMSNLLIKKYIIIGKSTYNIFQDLSLDPFNELEKKSAMAEFESNYTDDLIGSVTAQQMTFFRYLYEFFKQYPEQIEETFTLLFSSKKNTYRYM